MNKSNRGITLIALIITIIILLILAGITIGTLGGDNGLLAKTKQAHKAQIEADMKEQLILALQDLQIEKKGEATLEDITQEWIDSKISRYECEVKEDALITGKKIIMKQDDIIKIFLIGENLEITELETQGIQFSYESKSREGNNVNIVITITEKTSGIKQVELANGNMIEANGKKEVVIDYMVELEKEYIFKIITQSGEEKQEKLKIDNYYYPITKTISEGVEIDNATVKAAYNKPYVATVTAKDGYKMQKLVVNMEGKPVTINESTGEIKIDKVTGEIEIIATAQEIEVEVTQIIIGKSETAIESVEENSQAPGTELYINFSAKLENNNCTIEPQLPFKITKNGKYKFIATGIYEGKTITKDIEISVNKYKAAMGLVKYDAGEWTQEEIEELQKNKLYDLNENYAANATLKLDSDSGINLTFGGFTYKGSSDEGKNRIITSRNQSVGNARYEGWQIFESKDENGKTYVTKLIHAGISENFVYSYPNANDGMAKYIVSGGLGMTNYNKTGSGKTINTRTWDVYRDKELDKKGYIKEVHCITMDEYYKVGGYNEGLGPKIIPVGDNYWIWNYEWGNGYIMWSRDVDGWMTTGGLNNCAGIRPVITLNEGIYLKSGTGTEADPYILGRD